MDDTSEYVSPFDQRGSMMDDVVFFYGKNKGVLYRELSQWYPTTFTVNRTRFTFVDAQTRCCLPVELQFNCAEQFMMYSKALVFGDWQMANLIIVSKRPKEQQEYGRRVRGFDEDTWISVRETIVHTGNYAKFMQDLGCQRVLLCTGEQQLCEASPHDRIWGIGYTKSKALQHVDDWGSNLLGKILMSVRSQIRSEST